MRQLALPHKGPVYHTRAREVTSSLAPRTSGRAESYQQHCSSLLFRRATLLTQHFCAGKEHRILCPRLGLLHNHHTATFPRTRNLTRTGAPPRTRIGTRTRSRTHMHKPKPCATPTRSPARTLARARPRPRGRRVTRTRTRTRNRWHKRTRMSTRAPTLLECVKLRNVQKSPC